MQWWAVRRTSFAYRMPGQALCVDNTALHLDEAEHDLNLMRLQVDGNPGLLAIARTLLQLEDNVLSVFAGQVEASAERSHRSPYVFVLGGLFGGVANRSWIIFCVVSSNPVFCGCPVHSRCAEPQANKFGLIELTR